MAEEDKNKDKLQNPPVKAGESAAQNFDRLTVPQDAPDSDLSAKQYAADESMPMAARMEEMCRGSAPNLFVLQDLARNLEQRQALVDRFIAQTFAQRKTA